MRSVPVSVRRRGIAWYKALAIYDTRWACISVGIQVINRVNAAVDHRDPNASAIPAVGISDIRVDGRDDGVHCSADLAVWRDVRNVGLGSQAVQIGTLHSHQLTID